MTDILDEIAVLAMQANDNLKLNKIRNNLENVTKKFHNLKFILYYFRQIAIMYFRKNQLSLYYNES